MKRINQTIMKPFKNPEEDFVPCCAECSAEFDCDNKPAGESKDGDICEACHKDQLRYEEENTPEE